MDVFTQYFEVLSPVLLDEILDQLLWCVQQGTTILGKFHTSTVHVVAALENLVDDEREITFRSTTLLIINSSQKSVLKDVHLHVYL